MVDQRFVKRLDFNDVYDFDHGDQQHQQDLDNDALVHKHADAHEEHSSYDEVNWVDKAELFVFFQAFVNRAILRFEVLAIDLIKVGSEIKVENKKGQEDEAGGHDSHADVVEPGAEDSDFELAVVEVEVGAERNF